MRCCPCLRFLALLALPVIVIDAAAAEPMIIPQEIAVQISKTLITIAEQDANAPFKIDADAEKANGLYEPSAGGLIVVPLKGIKDGTELRGVDAVNGAGTGYLFLHKLTLAIDGKPVPEDKFPTSTFKDPEGNERNAITLRLALKKESAEKWSLLVFGKDKTPLATAPFRAEANGSDQPLSVSAKDISGDQATLVVTFVGKYAADVKLAKAP